MEIDASGSSLPLIHSFYDDKMGAFRFKRTYSTIQEALIPLFCFSMISSRMPRYNNPFYRRRLSYVSSDSGNCCTLALQTFVYATNSHRCPLHRSPENEIRRQSLNLSRIRNSMARNDVPSPAYVKLSFHHFIDSSTTPQK